MQSETMYLPKKFNVGDPSEAEELIARYPLATLISTGTEGLFVSHIPFVLEKRQNKSLLIGHFAKSNPHPIHLHGRSAYAIFGGPNHYITPKWYKKNNVPTWNYMVVHASGRAKILEKEEEIISCLGRLTSHMNDHLKNSDEKWDFWIPDDLQGTGVISQAIVGIEIEIESLQAKFKVSQNRTFDDRQGVIAGLQRQGSDFGKAMAEWMTQHEPNPS